MEEKIAGRFTASFVWILIAFYWLGLWNNWHNTIWWFDDVLHFAGGVWLGAAFVYLTCRWRLAVVREKFELKLLLGLGFVALVGVLWEFHEFLADLYLQKQILQPGLADTMSDLLLDLLGGLVFLIIIWPLIKQKEKS